MNKNIIIICLIIFLIFFAGCVEENETSTEIPSTNISSSPTPTVTQTPIIEVTSTPESSETWPKYIIRYDILYSGEIVYSNGRRVKVTEVIMTSLWPNGTLDVVFSDFKVKSYENAGHNFKAYTVTREISRETYESYEKILAENSYGFVSLHIIYEPTPIVMDDAMQEIVDFLNEDKTNELEYTQSDNKKQIVFAKQLSKNATEHNLSFGVIIFGKMGFIDIGDNYALNYFTSNEQMYFIDPVTDELITVCEVFDYGYGYGKLYPAGTNIPLTRTKKVSPDLDLSEICNQRILTIPIATQTTSQDLDITLKSGYKLYQNNEYSYGFGYPEDWVMGDFIITGNQLQGVGMSHDTTGNGSMTVVVYSSDPKKLWDEMGGLDVLTEAGFITTRNSTVNGRVAFEVFSTENFMPATTVRYVTIQANGYYYMMTLYISDETYSTQPDKFDDIVNSWVIGNIE